MDLWPPQDPVVRMGTLGGMAMETDVLLPIAAGLVLIVLIVAGSVVVLMRPSDTQERKP